MADPKFQIVVPINDAKDNSDGSGLGKWNRIAVVGDGVAKLNVRKVELVRNGVPEELVFRRVKVPEGGSPTHAIFEVRVKKPSNQQPEPKPDGGDLVPVRGGTDQVTVTVDNPDDPNSPTRVDVPADVYTE